MYIIYIRNIYIYIYNTYDLYIYNIYDLCICIYTTHILPLVSPTPCAWSVWPATPGHLDGRAAARRARRARARARRRGRLRRPEIHHHQ